MAYSKDFIIAGMTIFFILACSPPLSTSWYPCKYYSDCCSLLKFKEAIISDPGGNLRAWNETTFFCNWTGIKCHRHLQHRVMSLELNMMSLHGRISPFLSNLSLLNTLSLTNNNFQGEVPSTLGELSQLTHLNLSGNNLEGAIPASLQRCQSLILLDLSYNNLSESIPVGIGWLKNLTCLRLSANKLTGMIPGSISNLTELTELKLAYNYLTGRVLLGIGALTKLEILYFHSNYLEGNIPTSIINCTALQILSLNENRLKGQIPMEVGAKLLNLQKLYLMNNQLSGKIPVSLSNLSRLTLLDLSFNELEGEVPLELGRLQRLEILYLHSNWVGSSSNSSLHFLTALTNCSFIKKLHLASCLFAGSLPDSVGDLSQNLHYFNLFNNQITGRIPDGIGNLSSLVSLDLRHNWLNTAIPVTFGNLRQLQRLYLGGNVLCGPIPNEIGQMSQLGLLDLSNNMINGSIPSSLGNLSRLNYLYLSQNRLSGIIPIELNGCYLLMLLDLSLNCLQGSLPIEIGIFSNLALSLNLSNNMFEGEIPVSIGSLASTQAIDLSRNKFYGLIPSSIGSCIALEYLNLSSNMLEGTIPESLKQITHLKVLDLAFNRLNGEVPMWIGEHEMIEKLNLSYNRLVGELPKTGYKFFERSSFMGNTGLCGDSSYIGLSPCKVQEKVKNKSRVWAYFVVLIFVSCILLPFVLVTVLICRRFSGSEIEEKVKEEPFVMVSPNHHEHGGCNFTQRELEIVTGGFHESNLLGQGSFGSVYKAIIDGKNTMVAIKVLHKEFSQSKELFKKECQILSGIKHRNLVKMIGTVWSAEFKAIVLQFVGNGNLERHLYPSGGVCALTLKERLGIAMDIAHGLEYLHEGCPFKVVHCDLKPENVLLDDDMMAHIADFGIAKVISADKPNGYVSSTGFLRGSIGYIPPEYGQEITVSDKGDVYSFGVMMLEIITRKRPTSEMFSDGHTLRQWVSSAFPDHIMDAIDTSLEQQADKVGLKGAATYSLEQCCSLMLGVGLMCTEAKPRKRPPISLVAQRLENIWRDMGFEMRNVDTKKSKKAVSGNVSEFL